jgi:hypothetical protein
MFSLTEWFHHKAEEKKYEKPPIKFLNWRNNMWVVTPDGVGIIFRLDIESLVHLVDYNGNTVSEKYYPTLALRQAKYLEIPAARRGFTKEAAYIMGYF